MVLTLVTMASATVMHAATNHLVDAVLALILMVGGVIGAQFGARAGQKMRGERLRLLLGVLVLAVGLRFAYDLVVQPDDLFSIRIVGGDDDARRRTAALLAALARRCAPRRPRPSAWWLRCRTTGCRSRRSSPAIDLVLFGTVEPDAAATALRPAYDLVVTVTGPRQTDGDPAQGARVRHLGQCRVARIRRMAPSYLAVLSNRPSSRSPMPRRCAACRSASIISAAATLGRRHRRHGGDDPFRRRSCGSKEAAGSTAKADMR